MKATKITRARYAGLALINGVMIRDERALAVAVRLAGGGIQLTLWKLSPGARWQRRLNRIPFLRGLWMLSTMLESGRQLLNHALTSAPANLDITSIRRRDFFWSALFVIAGLFVLPAVAISGISWFVPALASAPASALAEIILRVILFVGALAVVMPLFEEMGGVVSYHGAEHQVIFTQEAGARLTAQNMARYSTLHPRCGTNLALLLFLLASLLFGFLNFLPVVERIAAEIILLPVVGAVGTELMLIGSEHWNNPLFRALTLPGLALQLITTRVPRDEHREVALAAMRGVIELPLARACASDLAALLQHSDASVRADALAALGETDRDEFARAVLRLIENADWQVASHAQKIGITSGAIAPNELLDRLLPRLGASEPATRALAFARIAQIDPATLQLRREEIIARIENCLNDEDATTQSNTLYLLSQLGATEVARANAATIIARTNSPHAATRANAVYLLDVAGIDAAPEIIARLNDAEETVVWCALQAVKNLNLQAALGVLNNLALTLEEGPKRNWFRDAINFLSLARESIAIEEARAIVTQT
ncbi:MAG: DUF1385 domain-containing protein [Chloroflexi bacterium]|nr:DUF1385 domain-containing protein [Chloroflexota bacterium]